MLLSTLLNKSGTHRRFIIWRFTVLPSRFICCMCFVLLPFDRAFELLSLLAHSIAVIVNIVVVFVCFSSLCCNSVLVGCLLLALLVHTVVLYTFISRIRQMHRIHCLYTSVNDVVYYYLVKCWF